MQSDSATGGLTVANSMEGHAHDEADPRDTADMTDEPNHSADGEWSDHGSFGRLDVDTSIERDSTLGSDSESFTTSLNSSVTDYIFEYGRRYHAYDETKYALPNDEVEMTRLELQHGVWHHTLSGRLTLAPIPSTVRNVLDIGCGSGLWAIDFAERYPHSCVTGTDLSAIQPTLVPPNLEFIIDDFSSAWLYDRKFDYIHSRAITVGVRDWVALVDECWRNLAPGGWVEFQEYHAPFLSDDNTIERGQAFKSWNTNLVQAAAKAGTKLDAILEVPQILKDRGFVHLGSAHTKWPLGTWPRGKREKTIGDLFAKDITLAVEGASMRMFTKILGWHPNEVIKLIRATERDIQEARMHAYLPCDFVWAQKPLDAES